MAVRSVSGFVVRNRLAFDARYGLDALFRLQIKDRLVDVGTIFARRELPFGISRDERSLARRTIRRNVFINELALGADFSPTVIAIRRNDAHAVEPRL